MPFDVSETERVIASIAGPQKNLQDDGTAAIRDVLASPPVE